MTPLIYPMDELLNNIDTNSLTITQVDAVGWAVSIVGGESLEKP